MSDEPKATTLGDYVPRELRINFDLNSIIDDAANVDQSLTRMLTSECAYYVLASCAARTASLVSTLECRCHAETDPDNLCAACCRSKDLLNGAMLTDKELRDVLRWIGIERTLRNSCLGKSVDLRWIDALMAMEWDSLNVIEIMRPCLDAYLLPQSQILEARTRLVNRLRRMCDVAKSGQS
jgi:hypothetical protein